MRIALCDDEKTQQLKYQTLLQGVAEDLMLPVQITCYSSGEELLFHLEDVSNIPDIVFLDIHMPKMNGMELARCLRDKSYKGEIVFLTVSKEYILQAFDVQAFHYIFKEHTPEKKMRQIVHGVLRTADEKQTEYLLLSSLGEYRNIPIQKIEYFEIMQRLITVHYGADQQFEFISTFAKLEASLFGRGFIRISKSFLVSISHVAVFTRDTLTLFSGVQLPVGRKYYKPLKDAIAKQARL